MKLEARETDRQKGEREKGETKRKRFCISNKDLQVKKKKRIKKITCQFGNI